MILVGRREESCSKVRISAHRRLASRVGYPIATVVPCESQHSKHLPHRRCEAHEQLVVLDVLRPVQCWYHGPLLSWRWMFILSYVCLSELPGIRLAYVRASRELRQHLLCIGDKLLGIRDGQCLRTSSNCCANAVIQQYATLC